MAEFEGVCPVVATPFTESEDVDYESLTAQVGALAAGGCHGAVLFGFAGEFYKLTDEEQGRIVTRATDIAADVDLPLYVSVTAQSTKVAADRARAAASAGADGLMLLPPFVADQSEADVREHVGAVADAVSLPVMVQYAPGNTGVTVPPAAFAEVSERHPNVTRYKVECTPPGGYVSALLDAAPDEVEVLIGSGGKQYVEALDRGAAGVVPGAAFHEQYVDVHERYHAGDREGALERHRELLPYLVHVGQSPEMFVHYEKRALAERGFVETPACREPAFHGDEAHDRLFEDHAGPLFERCADLRDD